MAARLSAPKLATRTPSTLGEVSASVSVGSGLLVVAGVVILAWWLLK